MNDNRSIAIERYVEGTMSPAEKSAFESELKASSELQRLVRAEQGISEVGARHRLENAGRYDGASPSSPLMQKLAATPGRQTIVMESGAAATEGLAPLWGPARWLTLAAGLIGLVIGTFLLAPLFTSQQPAEVIRRVDTLYRERAEPPAATTTTAPLSPLPIESGETTGPVRQKERTRSVAAGRVRSESVNDAVKPERKSEDRSIDEYLERQEEHEPIRVIRNDSIGMKMRVKK